MPKCPLSVTGMSPAQQYEAAAGLGHAFVSEMVSAGIPFRLGLAAMKGAAAMMEHMQAHPETDIETCCAIAQAAVDLVFSGGRVV